MELPFVNPAMLWGAAAIAAPIIIFLLTRFRYKRIPYAAIVFLQRALKKQQRRLRVENLLLLLIRCLIIILLAAALARPRTVSDVVLKTDEASKNVILVLDTSYSMGYQVGSETAMERALTSAREVIKSLEDGDKVMILGFDEEVRLLYPKPRQLNQRVKESILGDLEVAREDGVATASPLEIKLSQRGTDMGEVFHSLPRILRAFDGDGSGKPLSPNSKPLPKTVFLFTDAQRLGLLDAAGLPVDRALADKADELKKAGGGLVLIDCGGDEPRNASVVHLASLEPVVGKDLPCHLEAVVKNHSTVEMKDLTVKFFVDGADQPQKTVSLSIPAEESRAPAPLRTVFREAGTHRVEVVVESDGLPIDNKRQFVVDVREHVRVLLVDGERSRDRWESETDFLSEVLLLSEFIGEDGFGLLRPEVISESEIGSQNLSDYAVVLLANVPSLDDESVAALENYARGGGAVVFTLGGRVDAAAYNDGMFREGVGLFPAKLEAVQGGTRAEASIDSDAQAWVMRLGDSDQHVVQLFDNEEMAPWLRMPSIFGFMTVDQTGSTWENVWVPLEVIQRPADDAPDALPDAETPGHPLLLEKAFGRGRVAAWLSTIDYGWNNTVLYDGFYVPFWRQLVLDLAQRTRPDLNLTLGGRYERLLRSDEYAARVNVITPVGIQEGIVLEKIERDDVYRLHYPNDDERGGLQRSGIYTVTRRGVPGADVDPAPDYFAVLTDPREGDLAKFTAEELAKALEIPVQPVPIQATGEVLRNKGGASGDQEYWRELVALVVGLLALESLLASLFGRRRR